MDYKLSALAVLKVCVHRNNLCRVYGLNVHMV